MGPQLVPVFWRGLVMRVGLLSDTHVPEAAKELPMAELRAAFKGVDLIMHGGDIYYRSVLEDLAQIAPVIAARGDDDFGSTLADERVKDKHVLHLDGHCIWLIHERPSMFNPPPPPHRRAFEFRSIEVPEVVVFGHQHKTIVESYDGMLLVSPGSPTFLHYRQGLGTVGILNINDGKVDVNIIHL
jgi:putative phosphoesterase